MAESHQPTDLVERAGAGTCNNATRRRYTMLERSAKLPFSQRFDVALILLVVTIVVIAMLGIYLLVTAAEHGGWFDPAPIEPIPDDRKLTNVRSGKRLLSAVYHPPTNEVFISQQGRRIHRLEPKTGIWREELIDQISVEGDLVHLKSGCGSHDAASPRECEHGDALWALTEKQGLLRRDGPGRWKTLIGDTRFVGFNAQPVQQEELSTASVSADGNWLLVGTAGNGFGLFRLNGRYWHPFPTQNAISFSDVRYSLWWDGYFWLGTTGGLARLSPPEHFKFDPVSGIGGEVTALAKQPGGGLLVLVVQACREASQLQCQTLSLIDSANGRPREIFNETRFKALSQNRLFHAAKQGGAIVVAGEAGAYAYDLASHVWNRLEERPVTAVTPAGEGFLYGTRGRIGFVANGQLTKQWDVADRPVISIAFDAKSKRMLALNDGGDIYRLNGNKAVVAFKREPLPVEPASLTNGASAKGLAFLTGSEGSVVHDIRKRSYTKVSDPIAWIGESATTILVPGDVYAIQTEAVNPFAVVFNPTKLAGGSGDVKHTPVVDGPIRSVQPWGEAIALIDRSGSAVKLTPDGIQRLTGKALPGEQGFSFVDAIQSPLGLYVASDTGVFSYRLRERSWSEFLGPKTSQPVHSLGLVGSRVWGVTNDGDLVDHDRQVHLIGGEGLGIDGVGLSDVLLEGDQLLLAGRGRIRQYSLPARKVLRKYDLGGDSVKLLGLGKSVPFSLAGSRLWHGDTSLAPDAGNVLEAWLAPDYLWSVRQSGNERYLMGHSVAKPGDSASRICLYRESRPQGNQTHIVDAVEVRAGLIAVLTTNGLHFYDQVFRRWHAAITAAVRRTARLLRIGDSLVWVTPDRPRPKVRIAELQSLTLGDSCSTKPTSVHFHSSNARSVSISERGDRLAWITTDGRLVKFDQNGISTLLESQTYAPDAESLRRVFRFQNELLLTDAAGFWRYNPSRRKWKHIGLQSGDRTLVDVQELLIETGTDQIDVTVRTGGETLIGRWAGAASNVEMSPIDDAPVPVTASGETMLDAVQVLDAGHWAFLYPKGATFVLPGERESRRLDFPVSDPSRRILRTSGNSLAITSANESRLSILRADGQPWRSEHYQTLNVDDPANVFLTGPDEVVSRAANGAIDRCRAVVDQLQCQNILPPPTDVGDVLAAFEIDGRLLLVSPQAWNLLNPADASLSQVVDNPGNQVTAVQAVGQRIWITTADGTLRQLRDDLSGVGDPLQGRLVVDDLGSAWILGTGGVQLFSPNGLLTPEESFQTGEMRVKLAAVAERGASVAIDDQGLVHGALGIMQLPVEIDPNLISRMIAGRNAFWIVYGNELIRLVRGACTEDTAGDCAEIDLRTQMPQTGPVAFTSIEQIQGDWIAREGSGRIYRIVSGGEVEEVSSQLYPPLEPVGEIPDVWPQRRAEFTALDGGFLFNVPVLRRGQDGALEAESPVAGVVQVAPEATGISDLAQPLQTDWLRWNRATQRFELNLSGRKIELQSNELIADDLFAFTGPGTVVGTADGGLLKITQRGIWHFDNQSLSLVGGPSDYLRSSLPSGALVAHGRILGRSDAFDLSGQPLSDPDAPFTINLGSFRVTEDIRGGGLRFSRLSGEDLPIRGFGFPWDRISSVGFNDRELALATQAGIIGLTLGRVFDPPTTGARLWVMQHDRLIARADERWFEYAGQDWQEIAGPPGFERRLIDTDFWRWTVTQSGVDVRLVSDAQSFRLIQGPGGLHFSSDLLEQASGNDTAFVLITQGWMEVGRQLGAVHVSKARRRARPSVQRLTNVRELPTAMGIYGFSGADPLRWDPVGEEFKRVPPTNDPFRKRVLAENDRLSFVYVDGRVRKQIRIDRLDGSSHWVDYDFKQGRFPFDVVRAVSSHDNSVFIGTAAGLETYDLQDANPNMVGLAQIARLLDLGDGAQTTLRRIDRIGRPVNAPDRTQIQYRGGCRSFDGKSFGACADGPALTFARGDVKELWRWELGPIGPVGRYRTEKGEEAARISLRNGRFEHDVLRSIGNCKGTSATAWRSRHWVTVYHGDSLALDTIKKTYVFGPGAQMDLFCLDHDVLIADGIVPAGLYLKRAGSFFRFAVDSWEEQHEKSVKNALSLRQRRDLPVDETRLRIRRGEDHRGLVYEHRRIGWAWEPLLWQDRVLEIDDIHRLEQHSDILFAATRGGVVTLTDLPNDLLGLDPTRVHRVSYPPGDEPCRLSDLSSPMDVRSETNVWIRCNGMSDRVFAGLLSTTDDEAGWNRLDEDPFVKRLFVEFGETSPLRVTRVERQGDFPGSLRLEAIGGETSLVAGRFDFDAIETFLFDDSKLNLVTNMGWIQVPGRPLQWHLSQFKRPDDPPVSPGEVIDLAWSLHDKKIGLCVASNEGTVILREQGATERVEACTEYLGNDGLWHYERSETGLSMFGQGLMGKQGKRRFKDGRFGDQMVVGLPVDATLWEDGPVMHLVPTLAGIVAFEHDGTLHGLYLPPFRGLPESRTPSALYLDRQSVVRYVGEDGLRTLVDDEADTWSFDLSKISQYQPLFVEESTEQRLIIKWWEQGVVQWLLLDRDIDEPPRRNHVVIPVGDWPGFRSNRHRWGNPAPYLDVALQQGMVTVTAPGRKPLRVDAASISPLDFVLARDRMLLIEDRELWDFDIGHYLSYAFEKSPPVVKLPPEPQEEVVETPLVSSPFEDSPPVVQLPPKPSEKVAELPLVHVIQWHGENLSIIAEWYTGDWRKWREISTANPSLEVNSLLLGDKVRIPSALLIRTESMPKSFVDRDNVQ